MATLKIKNEHGGWDDIPALRGRDGAIQYTAGANIEISSDNVISARGLENTVTREDVTEMIDAAVPTDVSDLANDAGYVTSADVPTAVSELTNDSGYVTSADIPTKTSDLVNDGMGDRHGQFGYAAVYPRDSQYPWGISIEGNGTTQRPYLIKPIIADVVVNKPLAFKDEIPTALSSLTNDAGFVTSAAVPTKTSDLINDSGFVPVTAVPVNVSDLNNDTGFITANSLPTKTSDLTNDSGFITASSVPVNTSDLVNDSGFITSSDVPDATSDLLYDSVLRARQSGSSYPITGIYGTLNKILVNNNQLDLRQFGILTIQMEEPGLNTVDVGILPFNHITSDSSGTGWNSSTFGTLMAGVDGQYDTMLQTSERITAISNYSSYVELTYSQQFLFVNKANILSGNTGNYALKSKISTMKLTRYTS